MCACTLCTPPHLPHHPSSPRKISCIKPWTYTKFHPANSTARLLSPLHTGPRPFFSTLQHKPLGSHLWWSGQDLWCGHARTGRGGLALLWWHGSLHRVSFLLLQWFSETQDLLLCQRDQLVCHSTLLFSVIPRPTKSHTQTNLVSYPYQPSLIPRPAFLSC